MIMFNFIKVMHRRWKKVLVVVTLLVSRKCVSDASVLNFC